jgi:transcriptional regulator with XRE-family HTH domain
MPRPQHSARYKELCRILIDARKKTGLTQAVVAERLQKPQSFVAKYENGERRLDVIELLDVAVALGTRPETLIRQLQRGKSRD